MKALTEALKHYLRNTSGKFHWNIKSTSFSPTTSWTIKRRTTNFTKAKKEKIDGNEHSKNPFDPSPIGIGIRN
jgi:hypothetical protein